MQSGVLFHRDDPCGDIHLYDTVIFAGEIIENLKRKLSGRWGEVLALAWPLVVASSFWNLQLTIDRVFLGNYSIDTLAAATAVSGVFWTPMALLQQTAAYVTTFVAQYYGAKKLQMVGPAVWQSIYVSIAGGLAFLLLIPIAPSFFALMGHSTKLQHLETLYFQAICFSALPTALVAAGSGFYTGLGQSRVIMWINGVGLVANVLFDYLLIFGNFGFPELGIAGAGIATALANLFAALFTCFIIFRKEHQFLYRIFTGWRLDRALMWRFLRFGLPSGMQWALEGLAFTFFLIFVGRMVNGEAALSASGIGVTILLLAVIPTLGVGQAVAVLVGQHLGEKKPDRAEQSAWRGLEIATVYIFLISTTFILFPSFYLSWFHNEENIQLWQKVSTIVPYILMFIAAFTLFDGVNIVFSFALKGAGDTKFVTLVALTAPWPLMVLPTWLVHQHENAIYWSWAAASLFITCQAFIFWRRFVGEKWKSMSVIE